jgi:hypothetical protein
MKQKNNPVMLDRLQHLELFLKGSGDNPEDTAAVVSNKRVQKEIYRHPLDSERLFKAVCRASNFEFSSHQTSEFVWLFGRY